MNPSANQSNFTQARKPRRRRLLWFAVGIIAIYLLAAYVAAPLGWRWYGEQHPSFEDVPRVTYTSFGVPGDALNVSLVGGEADLNRAFAAAGWLRAAPLDIRDDLRIGLDSVLGLSYPTVPVSNLFLFGRKEDLAFEMPYGPNPRQRHHVRFWRSDKLDKGQPIWLGGATFDRSVGFSRTTGQITHHIAPDIDAERDHVIQSLEKAGQLTEVYWIDHFHSQPDGRNGGGDPYHTDMRLAVGVVRQ